MYQKLKKLAKKLLQYEASLVLKKYKPKIIAISGSVGKTLTREAVYLVLSRKFFVRKNEKSFTTELGVPLTIIGCPHGNITPLHFLKDLWLGFKLLVRKHSYPDWLILEIDGDKPGDLSFINSFLPVDILVLTAIGDVPTHVESFYDVDRFMLEKKYVVDAVKRDGFIVYNSDDDQVSNLLQDVSSRKISCGISNQSDVVGTEFEILYGGNKGREAPVGMKFDIKSKEEVNEISVLGSVGIHNEYACLLAFAIGLEFGIKPREIIQSLNKYKSLQGRMNLISGLKETIIIDDSYNSSPIAMVQAILVLGQIKTNGKKIAVLGDMLELGKYSADEHRKLATYTKDAVTNIICVGLRMRKLSDELLNFGFNESNILSVDNAEQAVEELHKIIMEGDIILIKGSQALRMERVVEGVMRHPEDKEKLLVRQEAEWLNRTD